MKKLFAVGATAALLMVATSPAFALDVDVTGDENNVDVTREGSDVRYNAVAQNIIGSIGDVEQSQLGVAWAESDASAYADDESEATADSAATAEVDQSQDFTVEQDNSALNDF
jgi:hypothetical protein